MVQTEKELIVNEYFEWMYHLVCNERHYNKVSYRKLLQFLNSVDYIPTMEMDENRMADGVDFRYEFGYENGYSNEYIRDNLDIYNCTILEMMIALAFRVESQITLDSTCGNRLGQWFWNMIVNLGLNHMNDNNFDEQYCKYAIDIFLDHKYQANGEGGLFRLDNPPEDMRTVDIWCQCMWYLNETIYDTDRK